MRPASENRVQLLRSALEQGNLDGVRRILALLTDADRVAVRKQFMPWVLENVRDWRDYLDDTVKWSRPDHHRQVCAKLGGVLRTAGKGSGCFDGFRLAAAACGTKTDVERVVFSSRMLLTWNLRDESATRHFHYVAGEAIRQRSDPWRDDLLVRMVDFAPRDWWGGAHAAYCLGVRLLQDGVISEPELLPALSRQARRIGFHAAGHFQWDALGLKIVRAALEDREEPLLASIDADRHITKGVVEATRSGGFERADILALALRRLAESSRVFEANWWGRLLESLEPTDAEWEQAADAVLDLIGAPNPRAVSAGLAAATALLKRRALDPQQLVPVLSLAMSNPVAASAKSAVTLLRRCAELDADLRLDALTTALTGLHHSKSAVHDAVLRWVESDPWWKEDPEALYAVANAAAGAPPTPAGRIDALIPKDGVPDAPPLATTDEPEPALETLRAEIRSRLGATTDAAERERLTALAAALDGGPLPAWEPDLRARWRNSPAFRVPETAEETAQLMLKVTVGGVLPEDWERIVAGIRRPLSPEEQALLPRLLDPIFRLRDQLAGDKPLSGTVGWQDVPTILRLAEAWIRRPWRSLPSGSTGDGSADRRHQLHATVAALARSDPHGPLGTPTHESGWLDPAVFTERLLARPDLPREELWELSSALYRLAPDEAARAEAWERLGPTRARWGHTADMMLAAALAPGAEAERAQVELVNWYREQAGGLKQVRNKAEKAVGWLRSVVGAPPPPPPKDRLEQHVELRLMTSALRCRHGMGPVAALEFVRGLLPNPYLALLQGGSTAPPPKDAEMYPWKGLLDAMGWQSLAQVIPELAPSAPGYWVALNGPVFAFPPVSSALAESALRRRERYFLLMSSTQAFALLMRADCPLQPLLSCVVDRIPDDKEDATAAVRLLATGLSDGRLRLHDVAEAFRPCLARKEAKPRALIGALELLGRQCPPAKDAAAVALEAALAGPLDGITPGDRVRLLEALLDLRSESGTRVEHPEAVTALEGLAAKGKNSRAGTLARQLLDLPQRRPHSSRQACLQHDVQAMLVASTHQSGYDLMHENHDNA